MAIAHKSSRVVLSLANWMTASIGAGQSITAKQVEAWRDGLLTTIEDLLRREAAVEVAEANQIAFSGPVDLPYAERLQDGVTASVKRLAYLAEQAATVKDLVEIDLGACAILDAFEALTHGVVRPAATPDIGA